MHSQLAALVATVALFTGCASAPAPAPHEAPAAPAAATSSPAAPASPALAATGAYGSRQIETACNGVDDDGDGLVDVLLPAGPNVCQTGRPGTCGQGFATCIGTQRVCLAPPPVPEVRDGLDNDCDGKIDDVAPAHVHPRALVLAPTYAWSDARADIDDIVTLLAQGGIPFDEQVDPKTWDASLDALATPDAYTLAILPGYLVSSALGPARRDKLRAFAERGGVVVLFKPLADEGAKAALELAGLRSSTRRHDVLDLRFEDTLPGAFADLDSPEERTLPLNREPGPDAIESYALEPEPGTEIVARGHVPGTEASPAIITRRAVGKGAVYAFGHDLASFAHARCYVNCFEPSGDVLRLFLQGALRESAGGHVVVKHTVPGAASSALLMTHDVDAPDADRSGAWGKPGALQMADAEKARGVPATFNITTDYVAGYFAPEMVTALCDLGMCPIGAHSVVHSRDFTHLPRGTCAETRATYGARSTLSLCGEIHVSLDILRRITGRSPRVWRSPYLEINPAEFSVMAEAGVAYDSSFGIGDLPYNLPLDLEHFGLHQDRFQHARLLEMPVTGEDGSDTSAAGPYHRQELQPSSRAEFVDAWEYIALNNLRNRSFTTILVHPSRGLNQPIENLQTKVQAVSELLDRVAPLDLVTRRMEDIGDFWRARLEANLDATYDDASGYRGTLAIGKTTAPGLTLEFGDVVTRFTCAACGPTEVHGKRVVITGALPVGTRASFVASTR